MRVVNTTGYLPRPCTAESSFLDGQRRVLLHQKEVNLFRSRGRSLVRLIGKMATRAGFYPFWQRLRPSR